MCNGFHMSSVASLQSAHKQCPCKAHSPYLSCFPLSQAENILLDDDDVAVIADFGLAKKVGVKELEFVTAIKGTLGFIAPGRPLPQPVLTHHSQLTPLETTT